MQVFLETDRLVLRRFSLADADNLVNLDADPDVMRYVTGGIPTSREEIENEFLPAFLGYYRRYEGYGFWAATDTDGHGRSTVKGQSSRHERIFGT